MRPLAPGPYEQNHDRRAEEIETEKGRGVTPQDLGNFRAGQQSGHIGVGVDQQWSKEEQ